jgi:hypothetical protein
MNRYLAAPLALGLLLLASLPAHAQLPRPERPYRGLFGGGTGNWDQSLVATASAGAGWDDNLIADARGGTGRARQSDLDRSFRGSVAQASAGLQYSLSRNRLSLGATAGTTGRYYPSLTDDILRRDSASAFATVRITGGLSAHAGAAYMPYSLASLLSAAPVEMLEIDVDGFGVPLELPDAEIVSSNEHFLTYRAGLGYGHRFSRRTSLSASYQYRASRSSREARQFEGHSSGVRVTHNAGRGFNVRAGYRYSDVRYTITGRQRRNHLIDAGAGYNRSLSISRRTTFSFGTGTTATTRAELDNQRTRFRITGSARLLHEMGRTWDASLAYARGVRFDENFTEPLFSDTVTASVGGLLSPRLQFRAGARASTGRVGFQGGGFSSYRGTASLNYALSRYANLGVAYSYYYHLFGDGIAMPAGLPAGIDRHSVRAYVNVWAPLFQRSRRSNATR